MLDVVVICAVIGGALAVIIFNFSEFLAHPFRDLAILTILCLMALGMWFWDRGTAPPGPPELPPLSDNYGAARYAPEQFAFVGSMLDRGVFFGKSSDPENSSGRGAPVSNSGGSHTLICARTRAGKGVRVILPTLLRAHATSAMVIDPKGENAVISARARRLHSHVYVINPWGEMAGTFAGLGIVPATYNPLDILDRNDPNAVAIAQALAGAICPVDDKGKDSFWSQSAAALMTAVLLWICDQPDETKTLARAREIVSLSRKELREKFLIGMVSTDAFGGAIRENAAPFVDMAPETYSGVLSNLARHTSFLSDQQIKAATATSSFAMTDLCGAGRDRPTTVYLVIPPDRVDVQKTWLRLMITAGMHTYKRRPPGSRYRCLFLIDEFPALGHINDIPKDIATMSGYGVDFALVTQGLADLKQIYGDAHVSIVNNCAYKWFCFIEDVQTAEYLSKTLGNKTVRTTSQGKSEGQSVGGGMHGHFSTSTGENTSTGETGRPLLMVDEALNLGANVAILLNPEGRPHYLQPVNYWNLQGAFSDYPDAYPELYFDHNACLAPDRPQSPPQPPPSPGQYRPARPIRPPAMTEPPQGGPQKSILSRLAAMVRGFRPGRPIDLTRFAPNRPETAKRSSIDLTKYAPKTNTSTGDHSPPSSPAPPKKSKYDLSYYSPEKIAERAREAAKKDPPKG